MATHRMSIADASGHTELAYRTDDAAEVAKAMAKFDDLVKNHKHVAYDAGKNGKGASIMRAFDPTVEEIVIMPQRVGG